MKSNRLSAVLCMTLFVVSLLPGCVTLRSSEKMAYKELEPRLSAAGLGPIQDKDSTLAGV